MIEEIIQKEVFEKKDLVNMLECSGTERELLFSKAREIKIREVGSKVHFRGLVEFSNICGKDCYYCGIRKSNKKVSRYNLSDKEILEAARFAYDNNYGSLVLQSGELESPAFSERIEHLLREIKKLSNNKLGITLSLGEQSQATYKRWFEAGAHRYLLRIESSNTELYSKLHPNDSLHSYNRRLECLYDLKDIG